jgi:general secretion pathway protein G
MRKRTTNRAFTLIEILIVVVILGILAAIVIPQFTDASDDAMQASVRSQLQTLRSQIELYNVQNPANQYDATTAVATFWDDLVDNDYLTQEPKNPMQDNSTTVGAAAAAGLGWVWDGDLIQAVGTDDALFAD